VIVTRQKKKKCPWRRLILPLVALALVIFAFVWGPSRNVISNGPMAPVWSIAGNIFGNVAEPFHYAAQNELLTEKNKQIMDLQKKVDDLNTQVATRDNKIKDLNATIQQMQLQAAQPSAAPSAAPAQNASAQGGSSGTVDLASAQSGSGSDLTQGATPDMRRTASFWANMEPENAAKLIQKQPVPYAARILALMAPDTVGAILDALPPAYAAKLTQDHPELKK
jgi:Tfp pilus assembly protein FimV